MCVCVCIYRTLRDRDATKFHIQLSIAIFFTLLVFLAGVDKIEVVGGCIVASVLIHYFNLVSILWMLAEALLLVQKLAFVFIQITKRVIIITSLLCWCKFGTIVFLPYSPLFPHRKSCLPKKLCVLNACMFI